MPRPRFSEMLVERRHQLGLTIEQAARVIKLKEQVLVAFEEGDFSNIPKSGYAQGMLSSYARYLGLNAREVVDQFQEDLYEHTNGVMSHELRRRTRNSAYGRGPLDAATNTPHTASTNSRLPEPSHLLPENPLLGQTDAYDTTSRPRSRTESYRQGSQLGPRSYPQGRPYSGRATYSAYSRSRSRTRTGQDAGRTYQRGDVVERSVRPREYTDDLRVENGARPYQSASTREGRQSYRQFASTQRPAVRRRSAEADRRQLRNRDARRRPQRSGFLGVIDWFSADNRRVFLAIGIGLVLILCIIISISVRSCTSGVVGTDRAVTVESTTSEQAATTAANTSAAAATSSATTKSSTSSATTAATSDTTAEPVSVKISVNSGSATWVEVTNDGVSEVAETVTGPWEQTFTVNDSITIRVGDTTAVSVTKNGENVQFDELSNGLGSLTIQGPGISSDKTDEKTDANTTEDSTDQSNSSKSTSTSNSSSSNADSTSRSSESSSRSE